jgi:hypothetical protein
MGNTHSGKSGNRWENPDIRVFPRKINIHDVPHSNLCWSEVLNFLSIRSAYKQCMPGESLFIGNKMNASGTHEEFDQSRLLNNPHSESNSIGMTLLSFLLGNLTTQCH